MSPGAGEPMLIQSMTSPDGTLSCTCPSRRGTVQKTERPAMLGHGSWCPRRPASGPSCGSSSDTGLHGPKSCNHGVKPLSEGPTKIRIRLKDAWGLGPGIVAKGRFGPIELSRALLLLLLGLPGSWPQSKASKARPAKHPALVLPKT